MAFRNQRDRRSTRQQSWDYRWRGDYFITICTRHRFHWFGTVEQGQIHHSPIGKIVDEEWQKAPEIRPDMNLRLGPFVVMPNHFHGIVTIHSNEYNSSQEELDSFQKFGGQSKNLPSLIRGFKGAVTRKARKLEPEFAWQSRYHDAIINDLRHYDKVCQYIKSNPTNWYNDEFYSE